VHIDLYSDYYYYYYKYYNKGLLECLYLHFCKTQNNLTNTYNSLQFPQGSKTPINLIID